MSNHNQQSGQGKQRWDDQQVESLLVNFFAAEMPAAVKELEHGAESVVPSVAVSSSVTAKGTTTRNNRSWLSLSVVVAAVCVMAITIVVRVNNGSPSVTPTVTDGTSPADQSDKVVADQPRPFRFTPELPDEPILLSPELDPSSSTQLTSEPGPEDVEPFFIPEIEIFPLEGGNMGEEDNENK